MKVVVALACGIVFAIGLGVSGMTVPSIVIGFLDFFGDWNPALLFVMASAVSIYVVAWHIGRGRASRWGGAVPATASHELDVRLFAGAAIFGVGWGLAGVCPGPAITNLANPNAFTLTFVAAMAAGMALHTAVRRGA